MKKAPFFRAPCAEMGRYAPKRGITAKPSHSSEQLKGLPQGGSDAGAFLVFSDA